MKKIKFIVLCLTLIMVPFLSSCIDNEGSSSSSWDFSQCATVNQSYLGGGITLVTDNGLNLTLTNPSYLKFKDGTYPTRIIGYYKLADGEVLKDGKTSYNVTIVSASVIVTKDFNQKSDTLKNSYNLTSIDAFYIANNYITVSLSFPYANGNNVSFDMYKQKVGNDTLYVTLNYSSGGSTGTAYYQAGQIPYSFKMPTYIDNIQPKNDSIWVKISAKSTYETIVKSARCKYEY